ncbi:Hypothetical protein A7982_07708 [Minicystis rosea]|nr:Hypothetical protein A7982_07708 [Minicystis rosea]
MIRLLTSIIAVAASLSLVGCGGFRSYALPVSAAEGPAFFAPIAACASSENLQSVRHSDSLNVKAVPGVWVQYMVQPPAFNMVVVVEDSAGGPEAVAARAAAAKAKGDEIFACAEKVVARHRHSR